MVGESARGTVGEVVVKPRAEAESALNRLRELTRIHRSIDEPSRSNGADESDWICRLRKICLHARAIDACEIDDIDIAHVMAPELRAAYVQMDQVWKCIPPELKRKYGFDVMDGDYWGNEKRSGLLATYDHPTPFNLIVGPTALGASFGGDPDTNYPQLALWLGFLVLGYGGALTHLADILGADGEVISRLQTAIAQGLDEPDAMERMSSILGHGERLEES
ncbi:MAG: hypothetical protein OXO50_21060 [Caldilineaceae bacterium]|nr:hypothetical protein [Caldilineaceae bacterium]